MHPAMTSMPRGCATRGAQRWTFCMDDHDLAAKLLHDHFTATAALIALSYDSAI
jgi:hypothetical protein